MTERDAADLAADLAAVQAQTERLILMLRAFLYGRRHRALAEAIVDECLLARESGEAALRKLAKL